MKAIAIHPEQWRNFCEAFTQLNKGTMMQVQWHKLDGRDEEIARSEMFQKMTFDTGDACNDMISITLGQEGTQRINHVVIEPIHIRLKYNGEGQKIVQLEAENGVTLVNFHSGRFPLHFESEFASLEKAPEQGGKTEFAIPS
jgi:hypothetical protein